MTSRTEGFALSQAVPWIMSVVCLALAITAWLGPDRGPVRDEGDEEGADPKQAKTLEMALDISESENESLRRELDRLLRDGIPRAKTPAEGGKTGGGDLSNPELVAVAQERAAKVQEAEKRARDALALGTGNEAAKAIVDLANLGPPAFPALRQLWNENADPKVRQLLFPTLMFVGGKSMGMDFLLDQIEKGDDPTMHGNLLLTAATFVDRRQEPILRSHLIEAAQNQSNTSGLRRAAVRGLKYSKGPEVVRALTVAATDPNPAVRLAAFAELAKRKAGRDQLRDMISREQSPKLRHLGECHLMIGESG